MIELITQAQAIAHLKLTDPATDLVDLQNKINGATRTVLRYVDNGNLWEYETDENGEYVLDTAGDPVFEMDTAGDRVLLGEVVSATLLMLGYLWRDRDVDDEKAFQMGFVPAPVTALLYHLRTPVIG